MANPSARHQLLDSSQFLKTGILQDAEAVGITLAAGTVTAAEARTAQASRDCVWNKIQELLAYGLLNKSQSLSSAKQF